MKKALIFCRVSSKEQEETGYSLPAQKKLLEDYSIQHDYIVAKVFSISESASGEKQRKIFNEMLAYLEKNHIDILVVEKTDRLTRNHRDAVEVDKWINKDSNRQVHFVKENFVLHKDSKSNEKFIWNIKVSVAQYYIDNLSEEVKKGQKEKLSQGWLPTKPPIGYKTIGEKGHRIHVVDEITKPLAIKMFKYYVSGNYSLERLATKLYEEGLRSVNGKKVPKSRIHEYLSDPFYIGMNRWNGKQSNGNQETFIDKDIFNKVQLLLKGKTTPKVNKHDFPFKGQVKCAECKGLVTWEIQKGTNYGHCNHYRPCSQLKWVKEKNLENQVKPSIAALKVKNERLLDWIRRALKETHYEESRQYENVSKSLQERDEQLKKRLSALYIDKLDGKITEDFYQEKFQEFTGERNELVEQRKKLNTKDNSFYEKTTALYDVAQKGIDIYEASKEFRKRRLIKLIFTDMTLNNGILDFAYTKPYRMLRRAVEETNGSKIAENPTFMENIFELKDFGDVKAKMESLGVDCSNWLPIVVFIRSLIPVLV